MACKKAKKIFVTLTLCSLFLSTGCLQNLENSIRLENVDFVYPNTEKKVLKTKPVLKLEKMQL